MVLSLIVIAPVFSEENFTLLLDKSINSYFPKVKNEVGLVLLITWKTPNGNDQHNATVVGDADSLLQEPISVRIQRNGIDINNENRKELVILKALADDKTKYSINFN